jgi:transcriptional accessory protein Tex/SPT6
MKNVQAAAPALQRLIESYGVQMMAIGNGTASRESEQFVAEQLKQTDHEAFYVIVNEAGASVYSASDIARTRISRSSSRRTKCHQYWPPFAGSVSRTCQN